MATDAQYYRFAMRIFADFSGTIAIPAVGAALVGKWLDEKYETEPRYVVIFLVIAFLITSVSVWKKAKRYKAAYDRLNEMN